MRIINRNRLDECIQRHPEVEGQLLAWRRRVESAAWRTPLDLKAEYPKARILPGNRAIFEIMWNRYRVTVAINYPLRIVDVRFAGSHHEYDQIDAENV